MTNTILLALIAAALAWSCILRDPVVSAVRLVRQRRRVIPGAVPVALTPAPDDAASMQLLLCDADGKHVEHEIAVHFTDAPEQYRYAGKTYRQEKRRHTAAAHDVIWEYRRLALLLALLLWSGAAFAQDASVTIRRPDGTEAGTSASPLRTDPTGSTAQPITAAALPLPSSAATSTKQSDGSQKTQIVDGAGNVIGATSNALDVNIKSGAGSGGTAATDNSTFTAGTTSATPISGFYHSTVDTVTDGRAAAVGLTSKRALFSSLFTPLGVSAMNEGAGAVKVLNVDSGGTALASDTQATHDGPLGTITSVTGSVPMGRASAAVPTDVSADGDAVIPWYLRSGALSIQPTFAGVLGVAGNGASGTGVQRVTLANDSTGVLATVSTVTTVGTLTGGGVAHDGAGAAVNPLLTGCYASAAAPTDVSADNDATREWCLRNGARATQSTYAGVLASTGVGAAGTGTPRTVDVASGSTGSAPPTQASYMGGVTSGATGGLLTGAIMCDSQGWLNMTTATTTEIAPLVASRTIYICSIVAQAGGTTTMTFQRGTGTNCGTGTTAISPGFELTAQTGFTNGTGVGVVLGPVGAGTAGGGTTSGNAVCVTSSAAVNLHVLVRYAVF